MLVRMCHVMQYLTHPTTGEKLITEDVIKFALEGHKSIDKWAYILHDKDFKAKENGQLELNEKGEKIPIRPHFHVVLKFSCQVDTKNIAKWFGVPENFVESKYRGFYAFADNCNYLTHTNHANKHQYEDAEIKCNFDYRDFISKMELKRSKYGNVSDKTIRDKIRMQVMYEGMTLNEACRENPENYMLDYKNLEGYRSQYLAKAPLPAKRLNFYIYGDGGSGKDLCSTALARALYPDITNDDDLFFKVGAENVTFEGYDGQPVIIWSDCRSGDLLKRLGGRGNVFNVFDIYPQEIGKQNVKYSSVRLVNTINIVNSVQPFRQFYLGLSGQYTYNGEVHEAEDVKQACRRFPLFLSLHADDFDVYLNEGFIDLIRGDITTYNLFSRVRGSFKKLYNMYGDKPQIIKMVEKRMLGGVTEKTKELMTQKRKFTEDDIDENFAILADYGKEIKVDGEKVVKTDVKNNKKNDEKTGGLFNEFEGNDDKNNVDVNNLF